MDIRLLSYSDKDNILRLEEESAPDSPYYYRYSNNVKALDYIFENPMSSNAFGIYESEKLTAWGAYRTKWNDGLPQEDGQYEISSVVVDKFNRRKGIGDKLLKHMIDHITKHQNSKSIYLTVYPGNIPALVMYLRNGFVIYDFKKDVYGPGSDRLYLRLTT